MILAVFALAFVVMIYGVIPWEDLGIGILDLWWWFPEMTASFLLFAIIIGLIARMREGELTSSFVDGARDLLGVALIIGIARGITVIMNNGQITDTVLHWIENALGDTGEAAFAIVMFIAVPAAVVPDPVDVGARDAVDADHRAAGGFVDVPASLVVTAYQSASGIMNLFIPTSAVVMGGLAIARVPYGTYLRWVWPLLAALTALCVVVLGSLGGGVMTSDRSRWHVRGVDRWSSPCCAVIGLIAYARGPEHHRGDDVGTHGTKIIVVQPASDRAMSRRERVPERARAPGVLAALRGADPDSAPVAPRGARDRARPPLGRRARVRAARQDAARNLVVRVPASRGPRVGPDRHPPRTPGHGV